MELLKTINEYAQLINFVLFVAIIGWLIRISTLSRTALTDKQEAVLAKKDIEISKLEKASEILQLQIDSLEKDRDKLKSEISDGKVDPNGLLSSLEILKRKADAEVEEAQKQFQVVISESQLKEKELELLQITNKKLQTELEERDKIQSSLFATFSHEARAATTSIATRADFILYKKNLPDNKIDEYLKEIIFESQSLNRTLDLLAYKDKDLTPQFTRVSLKDLIQRVINQYKPKISEKNLRVQLIGVEKLPIIKINESTLMIAISNLLDNSISYTEIKGKIEIEGIKKSNLLELKFRDFGIGISETDKEHIFKAGFRSKEHLKVKVKGAGLGLFITKKIVELNGGTIFVSNSAHPTEITVTLPLEK